MKVAFFNTKPYDLPGFRKFAYGTDLELKFYESRLTVDSAQLASGYNNVDIERCSGKMGVVHVPAYSPYAVAEHAMARCY